MDRRTWLAAAAALAVVPAHAGAALRLGAAWRGAARDDEQRLGVLEVDAAWSHVSVRWSVALPSRAHGLVAEEGGGLLAVAMRPGAWLLRTDAQGRIVRRHAIDDEPDGHRLDGHAIARGEWLYTTQTDRAGQGHVAVRERESLKLVDRWPTHGVDPHQLLFDARGDLIVANGGILRAADGRKRDLDRMSSSLIKLDGRNGALAGRWALDDARLSLRHLAWARGDAPLLGIALQAEHDHPAERERAPVLAVWDGERLALPSRAADGGGYAGDIAPAGPGGFALSAQKLQRGLAWWPQQPATLHRFAEIQEPCALASPAQGDDAGAVLLAGGLGLARWHPRETPRMLRWPQPMALDNHWVVMT